MPCRRDCNAGLSYLPKRVAILIGDRLAERDLLRSVDDLALYERMRLAGEERQLARRKLPHWRLATSRDRPRERSLGFVCVTALLLEEAEVVIGRLIL